MREERQENKEELLWRAGVGLTTRRAERSVFRKKFKEKQFAREQLLFPGVDIWSALAEADGQGTSPHAGRVLLGGSQSRKKFKALAERRREVSMVNTSVHRQIDIDTGRLIDRQLSKIFPLRFCSGLPTDRGRYEG